MLQRYRFWQRSNGIACSCASGMDKDNGGQFVEFKDVEDDLKVAAVYRQFHADLAEIGYTDMAQVTDALREVRDKYVPVRTFEIWIAGIDDTLNNCRATLVGTASAQTFREACVKFRDTQEERWKNNWNIHSTVFIGHMVFPTKEEAIEHRTKSNTGL